MVEVVLCNQPATRGALTAQSGGVGGGVLGAHCWSLADWAVGSGCSQEVLVGGHL